MDGQPFAATALRECFLDNLIGGIYQFYVTQIG
jgi:hypothetical protein